MFHSGLLYFGVKYPLQTCRYHGPVIVLLQLAALLWHTGHDINNFPRNALPASVSALCTAVSFGLLTNQNWLLSALTMIIVVVAVMIYYAFVYLFIDGPTSSVISFYLTLMIYSMYRMEK